jgi:hypothetical protein
MDIVRNWDGYINIPLSQTYVSCLRSCLNKQHLHFALLLIKDNYNNCTYTATVHS